MILITVKGDTFNIRKRLKENHFLWDEFNKEWTRVVGEAKLNSTVQGLRPMRSWNDGSYPNITVILTSVDVHGRQIGKKMMGIKLLPECLSENRDIYQEYQDYEE